MFNFKNKKILVTGHKGFIGKHFLDSCDEYGFNSGVGPVSINIGTISVYTDYMDNQVYTSNVRIEDDNAVKSLFEEIQPNVIVHLAAIPVIKPDAENPNKIIDVNITGTHNLLRHCPQGCQFIFVSTVTVYGDKSPFYASNEESNPAPTSVYAATKLAGENLVNIYTQQGKVSGISLRLCAVTGKYSTHGIVHDFVKKLDSDSEFLEVLGSEPGSCKPFLYADDVCEAIAKTIQINPIGRDIVVNICNEGGATVKQVAEAVMQAKKIFKPIKWLGDAANWKGDNKLIKCDSTYAKEILDWEPKYNSYQAIFKAVEDKMLCQN